MDELSKRHFADDPYSYRKYGAKGPTLSRDSTRHYFKCNVEGCRARKVIEISHADNSSTAQMIEEHDHPPPTADARGNKRKPRAMATLTPEDSSPPPAVAGDGTRSPYVSAQQEQVTKSKRASAQNVSSVVALCKHGHAADDEYEPMQRPPTGPGPVQQPPRPVEAAPQPSDAFSPRPKPAGDPPSSEDKEVSKNNSDSSMKPSDAPSRSAAAGTSGQAQENGAHQDYPGHEGVLFSEPRTEVVQWQASNGTLGLLFHADEREYHDLYSWRKYGKKHIKGYSEDCPRFYWRCTDKNCDIKRHTQATATGDTEVFYYGRHNHSVPERKSGRGYKRSTDAAAYSDPRPARTVRRKAHTQWEDDDEDMLQFGPSSPCEFSQDSQRSDHASEFEDFSRGNGGLELPAGEGRCPLFFLACVAAKEPSSI